MIRPLKLEVFPPPPGPVERLELEAAEFEEARLASYEQGYTAGWDDAVAAQDSEIARLRADLGHNLQDLSFTYHEAHSHVLRTLEPLLSDMVAKVLPAVARKALGGIVLDQLRPLAAELAGQPITVVANPVNEALLQRILLTDSPIPLTIVTEPTLGEGQVFLRLGEAETRIDIDGVIEAITAAVSDFFTVEKNEVRRHG